MKEQKINKLGHSVAIKTITKSGIVEIAHKDEGN